MVPPYKAQQEHVHKNEASCEHDQPVRFARIVRSIPVSEHVEALEPERRVLENTSRADFFLGWGGGAGRGVGWGWGGVGWGGREVGWA